MRLDACGPRECLPHCSTLKDFVVGSGVGLFAILKFLKGRRIWKHENVQAGQVRGS